MRNAVRTLTLSAVDADAMTAWQELADRAAEPNPFLRPDFVLSSIAGREEEGILVVVAGPDGWLACLPLRRARSWRRQPLPVLTNWLPQYSYLAAPLVAADAVTEGVEGLADFVQGERRAAAMVLDPLHTEGPVTRALLDALKARGLAPFVYAEHERAALHRRPEPTYLEEAASSKRRKELRRQRRGLERDVGEVRLLDQSHDPPSYDRFLALERESWKGEMGTALADIEADAAFFREMCARMAAHGHAQLLELRAGEVTAAMQINLVDGGHLFGFKVAFDHKLARYSPGALLEVDALDAFHASPTTMWADSCAAPDNDLMNALWPDRLRVQTVLIPTGAPHAKLLRPSLRAERGARRAVRAARDARRSVRDRRR